MRLPALLPALPFAVLLLAARPAAAQDGLRCLADSLGGVARVEAIGEVVLATRTEGRVDGEVVRAEAEVTLRRDGATWRSGRGARRQSVRATPDSVLVERAGEAPLVLTGDDALRVRQSAWLLLPTLLLRHAEARVEGDCAGLLLATVPDFPEPLVVQLGESGHPALLSTFREQGGQRVYLSVHYDDYRQTGGLWLPHRMEQAEGGLVTGQTRVTAVEIATRE